VGCSPKPLEVAGWDETLDWKVPFLNSIIGPVDGEQQPSKKRFGYKCSRSMDRVVVRKSQDSEVYIVFDAGGGLR
jgi:hypothetical protein